jgi:FkbM family methyltransferase
MRTSGCLRTRAVTKLLRFLFPAVCAPDLVRIGSAGGGWWIPSNRLAADSICYCIGAGEDISFDLGLVERYACRVWTVDPTPRAREYVESLDCSPRVTFLPVGVASVPGEFKFYVPRNPNHVSHSIKNLQGTSEYFLAKCVTIPGLMVALGHEHVDLIKLDVEGAEHGVLLSMLAKGIMPSLVCVEFDQPCSLHSMRATVGAMKAVGYRVIKVEALNLTLLKD